MIREGNLPDFFVRMKDMTKIRLIASDLDGTLLKDGAQSLRPDTCTLIERLLDRGIRFAAASGRQPDNLFRLFAPVKDRIDYVCQNGASAVVSGRRILYEPMDVQAAYDLAAAIRSVPGLELFVSDFECSYVEQGHDAFLRLVRDTVKINTEASDDILSTTNGCAKISIYEEAGIHCMEYWQKRYGDRLTVVTGGPQWLDFMPKGVNKQTALKRMLEELDIRPEEVMVFGDNLNDLEMLIYAGCGAAVDSAVPEILACADAKVHTVEDALAEIASGKDRIEDWTGGCRKWQ